MKMHKLGRFIVAIVCFPSALLAQTDLDRMMQAFDNVPVTAIMKDNVGIGVSFHNTAASRDVDLGRFGVNVAGDIFAFGLAAPNSIRDRLYLYLDEDWKSRVGFTMADVESFASVEVPPLTSWRIELSTDMSEEISDVLVNQGYEKTTSDGLTVFIRGGEDFKIDLAKRDPADPFGGDLGRASRVVLDGKNVYYSTSKSWLLMHFNSRIKPLTKHYAIEALAKGLAEVLPQDMRIIEVRVISNPDVFYPRTPRDPAVKPNLPAPLGLWSLGMIVTMTDGTREQVTAAFLMYNPDDAKRAATRMEAEWPEYRSLVADRTYVDIFKSPVAITVPEVEPRMIAFNFHNKQIGELEAIPLALSDSFMGALYIRDLPMFRAN